MIPPSLGSLGNGGKMIPIVHVQISADHPWLEAASWAGQLVLVVVASFSFVAAAMALVEAARSRRGTLLLELDSRWDSEDMKTSRKLLGSLGTQIAKLVSDANPTITDNAKHCLLVAEWAKQMKLLRAENDDAYLKLMGMLGFYETLGLMVRRKYIGKEDAIELFKGPILRLDMWFGQHMREREKEIGVPKGLFEHAFYLCDLAGKA